MSRKSTGRASALFLGAILLFSRSATADLLLWNTLGSPEEVTNSEVGPDFFIEGTVGFTDGVFGGAFYSTGHWYLGNRIIIPESGLQLDPEEGAIEGWAMYPQDPIVWDYNYSMFSFLDGGYQSGPGRDNTLGQQVINTIGDGVTGTLYNYIVRLQFDYPDPPFVMVEIPDIDDTFHPGEFHHVAVVWKRDGIEGTSDKVRVYIDGIVRGTSDDNNWGTTPDVGNRHTCAKGSGFDDGRPAFVLDELKVWNEARTDFGAPFPLTMIAGEGGSVLPESGEYPGGSVVPITAIPDPGWFWAGWVGEGNVSYTGPDSVAEVTILGPVTETAYFSPTENLLLTMVAGEGGTVAPVTGEQPAGSTVTITATPDSGYAFDGWTGSGNGSYTGPDSVASVTMLGPITQTAAFSEIEFHPLTMIAEEGGSVTPESGVHPEGTEVTITASPDPWWVFAGWTGEGVGSYSGPDSVATVTVNGPITQTAHFSPAMFHLDMVPIGGGTVTPPTGPYPALSVLTITATPDPGNVFQEWLGGGDGSYTGTDSVATITMLGPITEIALFVPASEHPLTMIAVEGGSVTPESGVYPDGAVVPITAIPDSGWHWAGWIGDGNLSYTGPDSVAEVTILGPVAETAYFSPTENLLLTMVAGEGGTVAPVTGEHPAGSTVTISATPDAGYIFENWEGTGVGSYSGPDAVADVTLLGPVTQSAEFRPVYLLTMIAGDGGVVYPQSGEYPAGTEVLIAAYPEPTYAFTGWTGVGDGSYTGPEPTAFVTMNGPVTQEAAFAFVPSGFGYEFTISASDSDPLVTVSPPTGGARNLYLWATCSEPGLSAMEADVVSSFPAIYGFTPAGGVLNIGTDGNLYLAITGCPTGADVDLLVGYWTVQDEGGTLCLGPSAANGIFATVDCELFNPNLWEDPRVTGFSSSAEPPCVVGTNVCQSPVSLVLSQLEAHVEGRTVVLGWVTSAEADHQGYHLYRAAIAQGPYRRLTDEPCRLESPCRWVDRTVSGGDIYYYEVGAVDVRGHEQRFGPVSVVTPGWDSFMTTLRPAQPNPFAGATEIRFTLERRGPVRVSIYDVAGRLLRRLDTREYTLGDHLVRWDGRDDSGRWVPAGIYFVRFEAGGVTRTRKVVSLGAR